MAEYPLLEKRLAVQERMTQKARTKGSGFENFTFMHGTLRFGLKAMRLKDRGLQNVINFKTVERDLCIKGLDSFWNGKKVLHLSDIHLDGVPGLLEKLKETLPQLNYDLCFITGDFRFGKGAFHPASLAPSLELLDTIKAPLGIFSVLGNHDFIEQVKYLEEKGSRVLMNENVDLGNGLYLAGVDDPHLFCCDDINAAVNGIPEDKSKILLIHSPEKIPEAAEAGFDAYLCGHTHGWQIAFPVIGAPFTNARCRRRFTSGEFEYKGMQGYTHRGTGASSVAARFGSPSEIVIHTLRKE